MTSEFLRRNWNRHSKLGKGRKKKQVWRKPKGRDNKMREKRKGYPAVVSIGYRKKKNLRGKINGKNIIVIRNAKDLEKVNESKTAVLGSLGRRKKIEIAQIAKKMKIKFHNLNTDKFLKTLKKIVERAEVKKNESK